MLKPGTDLEPNFKNKKFKSVQIVSAKLQLFCQETLF